MGRRKVVKECSRGAFKFSSETILHHIFQIMCLCCYILSFFLFASVCVPLCISGHLSLKWFGAFWSWNKEIERLISYVTRRFYGCHDICQTPYKPRSWAITHLNFNDRLLFQRHYELFKRPKCLFLWYLIIQVSLNIFNSDNPVISFETFL